MRRRRRSREYALRVLFQLNITKQEAITALGQFQEHFSRNGEADEFMKLLVLGVLEHREALDRLIQQYSENWRLDRINIIERNILRMALFELLYCEEIPPKVTINEAIDLGKRYGSEDSGGFINGILDRIQNEVVRKPI
ncbi:MAG TPA: transcription antitermination factor NusB [Thermodesulfobacteriota bacterium]|nr:transcription antitermination factor NusB [Thermodesulfobacteriota bacterium]